MTGCCVNCFSNQYLRKFIRKNGSFGNCVYCATEGIKVIDPAKLRELFEPVVLLYDPLEEGVHYTKEGDLDPLDFESLGTLLDEDWEVFSSDFDSLARDQLFDDIWLRRYASDDGIYDLPTSLPWARKEDRLFETTPENTWKWFADHLKKERRFIFEDESTGDIVRPEKWVGRAIKQMKAVRIVSPTTKLYRARIGYSDGGYSQDKKVPFPRKQMGAPPSSLARSSRANCQGISMFYAAFDERTAVAEAGRFPGAVVSVRQVAARSKLQLADLTKNLGTNQPFGVPNLESSLRHSRMLNQLNIELSRPVHPDDSAIEYLPTQYLAEAIRAAGYDGICFRSSLNWGGVNAVIFDPENMRVCRNGHLSTIESVEFDIRINIAHP